MLQVWLLGQFEIKLQGRRVVLATRAAQSLLAYLMLNVGAAHRREKLAGMFWSELPEPSARRNLRTEVWRIRKALVAPDAPDTDYILADDLTLAFNPNAEYWLDAAQLQRADVDAESLSSSLSLYRGELLPGLYDDWISLEREHLQAVYENKMGALQEQLIQAERWNTVIEWSERWLAQGQTPEPAYRALMVAYAATSNRAQIAATYQRCQKDLQNDLGVEPSEETTRLYESSMRGQSVGAVDLTPKYFVRARLALHDEPPAPGEPPFKGLELFDEQDAAIFFGREELTAKLVHEIHANQFLAVVIGASGSGKSSLVRAGVVPALRRVDGGDVPSERLYDNIFILTPTAHPLEALAIALTRNDESVTATATLIDDLKQDPRALYLFLRQQDATHPSVLIPHTLLVIDQFEELFTLCRDEFERVTFIDNLLTTLSYAPPMGQAQGIAPTSPLHPFTPTSPHPLTVVLTLRADFYAHLAQYPELRDAVAKHQEFMGPMTSDELRRAMEEPAKQRVAADGAAWEFEPGLVDLILRDVGDEPGALPLLSHALLETWKRRSGHVMTLKGYHDAGGVRGAIAQTAENVYQEFSPQEQILARDIFLRLTELGQGTEDTRRRASFDELMPRNENAATVRAILTRLADARLITLHQDTAEVAHEALIREWHRLREWLNQDREGLRLHRQITEATQEWNELERDAGALYRGARLIQARDFVENNPFVLNENERAFLEASEDNERREAGEREEQQKRELHAARELADTQTRAAKALRQRALFLAGAFLLAVLLAALAFFLNHQSQQNALAAQNNFTTAERIRIASQAQIALDNGEGGDLPALLSLQSLKLGYSPEADTSLLNALKRGFTKQIFRGHTDLLWSADFSPDGKKIVTTSSDGTARLWDVQTGVEISRFTSPNSIFQIAILAPDGRHVVVGGTGPIARLWDTQTGQEVQQFAGHSNGVYGADFSNDGKLLVTSDGGYAHLWNAETGEQLRIFKGHTDGVSPVVFSPDERFIATSSPDGTARVWDVTSGNQMHRFDLNAPVFWVAFSPDGKFLLTSAGNNAQLWNIASEKIVQTFVGHTDAVIMADFSPDGRHIITGSADKTARVWETATGKPVKEFIGHTASVIWATFSPDGKFLLTASEDRTARLWNVQNETEPRSFSTIGLGNILSAKSIPVTLSPGSRLLFYATAPAVFDMQTGAPQNIFLQGVSNLTTLSAYAFSPDNQLLASGDGDGNLWAWDWQFGARKMQIRAHTAPIRAVLYSPDGHSLLSASDDKTARLWNAETGNQIQQFVGHTEPIRAIAFSPDGKFVLTGGDDKTARLWEISTPLNPSSQSGKEMKQFIGHTAPLRAANFSPDGKFIVTSGDDQTARVWDVATGKEIKQLIGHTGQVSFAIFSPDGKFILTGSADQTARLWDVSTGQLVREFAGHTSPVLYVGFTDDGRTIITGDFQNAYRWRASLDDVLEFTCSQLTRDLTDDERALYGIKDNAPTCAR